MSGAASDWAGHVDVLKALVVYDGPCSDSHTHFLQDDYRDVITYLQNNPHLAASNPTQVNVGGFTGLSVDISVPTLPTASDCPQSSGTIDSIPIFQTAEGDVVVRSIDAVRIISLHTNDATVTFFIQTSKNGREGFRAEAQRILDSLTFLP